MSICIKYREFPTRNLKITKTPTHRVGIDVGSRAKNTHAKPPKSLKYHPTRGTFHLPLCVVPHVALSLVKGIKFKHISATTFNTGALRIMVMSNDEFVSLINEGDMKDQPVSVYSRFDHTCHVQYVMKLAFWSYQKSWIEETQCNAAYDKMYNFCQNCKKINFKILKYVDSKYHYSVTLAAPETLHNRFHYMTSIIEPALQWQLWVFGFSKSSRFQETVQTVFDWDSSKFSLSSAQAFCIYQKLKGEK